MWPDLISEVLHRADEDEAVELKPAEIAGKDKTLQPLNTRNRGRRMFEPFTKVLDLPQSYACFSKFFLNPSDAMQPGRTASKNLLFWVYAEVLMHFSWRSAEIWSFKVETYRVPQKKEGHSVLP